MQRKAEFKVLQLGGKCGLNYSIKHLPVVNKQDKERLNISVNKGSNWSVHTLRT